MNRRTLLQAMGSGIAMSFSSWPSSASEGRDLLGYIRTNWSQDPLSYGSYSYIAKGARQRDSRILEKPVDGRLFFAGEAAHPKYNSTVHAAYESGQRAARFVLKEKHRRVAIIGAGMSGLSAAHRLSREHVDVTIFEARDRIGGRVWTDDRLGMPLDLGASWIHGIEDNPLMDLADRAGQTRVRTEDAFIIRGNGGRIIAERDAPDWLDNVVEAQNEFGADYDQLNMRAYLLGSDYDGPDVKFPGGYADIFQTLAGPYEVNLSSLVTGVTLGEANVLLGLEAAKARAFDAVIVTVPLGVLKAGTLQFSPPLPEQKLKAISRLGMGLLDKLYLLFERPFWDLDADWIATPENGLPEGQFNLWLNLHKYLGQPIILAFNGGSPALSLAEQSDETLVEKALRTLTSAYPM